MEAEVEEDPFDMFPDEVLQLIFASVADCRSLIRCMAVSRAFREQSRRVPSLFIICPGIYSTYEQKLRGIYSMVKEFRALKSLVVRVGQPKIEPPTWARCMRYAEIGTAVDKFVFMAAKSGDFSEFDVALGGPQFTHPCNMKKDVEGLRDVRNRETILNQALVVIPEECALDSSLDRHNPESIHIDDHKLQSLEHTRGSESSRPGVLIPSKEEECEHNPRLESEGDSNIALGRRVNLYDEASSSSFSQTIGQGGNKNRLQGSTFSMSSRNKQMARIDHEQDRRDDMQSETVNRDIETPILQFSPSFSSPERQTFGHGNWQLPDFNLRQVIAPGNDVLKRMVPVIVFAIVQGLDEFRDSVPAFISNFRELKRFMLVDMVESVTVHMREHQIQQIREQRLHDQELGELVEDISRHLGMDKKDQILGRTGQGCGMIKFGKLKGIHSYHDNQFGVVGGVKFSTDEQQQQLDQWVQEHGDCTYQTNLRNSDQNKGKGSLPLDVDLKSVNIVDVKLKSVELSDILQDSSGEQHSSSGWKIRSKFPQNLEIDDVFRQTKCDDSQSINPLYAGIDQDTDSEESTASNCCGTSGLISTGSMATSPQSDITGTSMQFQLGLTEGKLGNYQQVIGKWSCDNRLKRWLSGRQSLAGASLTEDDQLGIRLDSDQSEGSSSQMPGLHPRSFEEIMACRLGDQRQNLCSSTSKEVDLESAQTPQQSSPHVTFSDLTIGPSLPSIGGSSVPVKGLLKHSSIEHGQLANQILQAKASSATVGLSEHKIEKHDFNILKIGCSEDGHNVENSSLSSSVILDRFRYSDSPSTSNIRKTLVSQEQQKLRKEQRKQEFLVKELARKLVEKPEQLANRNYRMVMMAESTSKGVKEQSKGHGLMPSAGVRIREGRRNLQQSIATYSFKGHLRVDTSKRRQGNQATYIGRLRNKSQRYVKQHQAEDDVARKTKIMKSGVKREMEGDGLHLSECCGASRSAHRLGADGINSFSVDIDQYSSLTGKELKELEGKQGMIADRDFKSMQETTDFGESMQAHESYYDGTENYACLKNYNVPGEYMQHESYDVGPENLVCLKNYNLAQGSRLLPPCNPDRMSSQEQQFDSITILDHTISKRKIGEGGGAHGSGDLGGKDLLGSEDQLELAGSAVQLPYVTEIGRERQQLQGDARRLRWALGRFRSSEQFRSRGNMHRQIAQLRSRTSRVVEDDARLRDWNRDETPSSWRESFRERLGRRVREMRNRESSIYQRQQAMTGERHGEQPEVAERESRRERLREGVRQRQRDIEKEALFFDISFWRAEQVVTHNYSLFDVSMCIATHAAKALTSVELDIISRAALAGPLLAATVTHVNREHFSHNL